MTLGLYTLKIHNLISIGIPILNLGRSSDRLRFTMGIPIPVRPCILDSHMCILYLCDTCVIWNIAEWGIYVCIEIMRSERFKLTHWRRVVNACGSQLDNSGDGSLPMRHHVVVCKMATILLLSQYVNHSPLLNLSCWHIQYIFHSWLPSSHLADGCQHLGHANIIRLSLMPLFIMRLTTNHLLNIYVLHCIFTTEHWFVKPC